MLSKLMGTVILLGSIVAAVETSQYALILLGVAAFVIAAYLAVVALNSAALNISIVPELRTAEQTLGVLTFVAKARLRLMPVAFGVGVICGTLVMACAAVGRSSAARGYLLVAPWPPPLAAA